MNKRTAAYRHAESNSVADECRETGQTHQKSKCLVKLPRDCTVYCGETLRDEIWGSHEPEKMRVCDCIIRISKSKISLVELKGGHPKSNVLEQFNGGIAMLKKIADMPKTVCLQAVLFTNHGFTDRSEGRVLKKPLRGVTPPVTICKFACGKQLPDLYVQKCRLV